MSWHYLQEQAGESLEDICSDGVPLPPLRSKITHAAFYSNGKLTASYLDSLSGTTCKPSMANRGEAKSMSSAEDFPAPTFLVQEKGQESKAKNLGCGQRWRELYQKYDPALCSWRTHQCLWDEDLQESSATLPKSGMMQDGILLEPTTQVRHRSAKDFGSLRKLNQERAQSEQRTGGFVARADLESLRDAGATMENGYVGIAESIHTHSIMRNGTVAVGAAPAMWNTPQANEDAAGTPEGDMQKMLGNNPLIRGVCKDHWKRGTLNPEWVEWLMGWPIGWTDLKPLGMDKCQLVRPWHGQYFLAKTMVDWLAANGVVLETTQKGSFQDGPESKEQSEVQEVVLQEP
jgi:hypothetical protein